MDNKIFDLQKLLENNLNIANDILFKRKCKISFKDVFYYLIKLVGNSKSSSVTVTSDMILDKFTTATPNAYIKKRKNIPSIFFSMLSNDLLDFHYNITNNLLFNKYRVLCTDGTHSPLSKNLINDNYDLTKNNTYVDSFINGIYDIYNNTVVHLQLSSLKCERKIYNLQFNYLQKDDIIIHDRGYFSYKLLYDLYSLDVNPIFRMKIDRKMNIIKNILSSNNDDNIYIINNKYTKYKNIKFRLIKYKINNKIYILGTTLIDPIFTIDILKNLYQSRWDIEVYFKTIKYDLSFKNFHSKSEELIKQEIYVHMCITQLTRILEDIYISHNKQIQNKMKTYKTNMNNNLDKIIGRISKLILYKNKYKKKIIEILKVMFLYLVKIRPNRIFARRAIKPYNKWYYKNSEIT